MRYMYFGNKNKMRWVKVDSPGRNQGARGYSDRLEYTNGGVALRESVNGHEEFTLTWNRMSREEARAVIDFAFQIYGTKIIHFLDPVVADQNVLNKAWSAPAITAKDGVPLAGSARPSIETNADLSLDYPAEMARYDLTDTDTARSFWVPIPPGHTAHIGVHGDPGSTLGVKVQRTTAGAPSGSPTIVAVTDVDTTTRFTNSFASSGNQSGIDISLEIDNGYIAIAGMIVQVLPTGTTPEMGGFILGQGASGCEFDGKPAVTPYSVAHDRVGLAVKLVETEDWQ